MKKTLLAIVLLSLLAVVSYVKVMRGDSREAEIFEKGKKSTAALITENQAQSDSITELLKSHIMSAEDSLSVSRLELAQFSDSMTNIILSKDSMIASINKDNKKLIVAAKLSSKPIKSKSKNSHHEILAHYKKQVNRLPEDLSKYERRVAIDEIREETVGKFSISMVKFNRIRKDNKINY